MAIPSVVIRRHIKAPVEAVFRAWTAPEAMMKWFSPTPLMDVPVAETDLRVGDRYRVVMREGNGEEARVGGSYREIVPNRKLVFTWAWESTPDRVSLVTIELEPEAGGTRLLLTHEMFTDQATRDRHERGWTGCVDRLVTFVETRSAA
jgi:uncharacterized protein YndB with AHSA1/START domain